MQEENLIPSDVDCFIQEEIDTVPQLEALLLLWKSRPRVWRLSDLAAALYVSTDATRNIVEPLERRNLIATNGAGEYSYRSSERDPLIDAVDRTYRRELIRISRMIHAKAPSAVREFARAFIFKKERD
jgi:hypothetical protein